MSVYHTKLECLCAEHIYQSIWSIMKKIKGRDGSVVWTRFSDFVATIDCILEER